MQDWLWMTASDLGRGIASGDIDPVALTETYLGAIDAHPLTPRIYSVVTHDRARAEAAAASDRAKHGLRRSSLDGVPISWKDLFDSAGIATEAGSKLLEGRVPVRDAEVLRNATAMGLVCLGKTHMSELAFSGLGLNPITATPPCVNNADAVPGGSSSGAAASVAFGLAAAGIGSDTGGSVRIPSAWNDLVGLKTTAGRVPLTGAVPLCKKFDTIGPLCRSVEDTAHLLAALEGTAAIDLRNADDGSGLRLGVLKTVVMNDIRDAPRKGYLDALDKLRAAGAELIDVDVPELTEAMPLSPVLYTGEAYGLWRDAIEAAPEKMFPEILERFRGGKAFGAADYVAAWDQLENHRAAWHTATAGFDAVLCPTAPIQPPDHDRLLSDHDYYVAENLLALRNTRVGNLMGLCAVTLPTGVPSSGMSVMGPPMDEERLLRVATKIDRILGR